LAGRLRYYGLYANAHRGKVKKASLVPVALGIVEEELRSIPSKGWAAMYAVVDRIIGYLQLIFVADKPPPSKAAFQEYLTAAETSVEYFS